jgi:uncharacterized protein YciI
MLGLGTVLLALAAQASPAPAGPAPAGPAVPDVTAYHVVSMRLGPRWQRDLPAQKQLGIREHGEYMMKLSREGVMVLGGPFLQDPAAGTVSGAMVVLATGDAAQARRWMEADPGVTSGLLEIGEIRRFVAAVGAWRPWHKSQP